MDQPLMWSFPAADGTFVRFSCDPRDGAGEVLVQQRDLAMCALLSDVQVRRLAMVLSSLRVASEADDWAIARLAELRSTGEAAKLRVVWAMKGGRTLYGFQVRRADGTLERAPQQSSLYVGETPCEEELAAALPCARF